MLQNIPKTRKGAHEILITMYVILVFGKYTRFKIYIIIIRQSVLIELMKTVRAEYKLLKRMSIAVNMCLEAQTIHLY